MMTMVDTFGVFDKNTSVQATFRDLVKARISSAQRRPVVIFENLNPSDTDKIPPGYEAVMVNENDYEGFGAMVAGTIDGASELRGSGNMWRFLVVSQVIDLRFPEGKVRLRLFVGRYKV